MSLRASSADQHQHLHDLVAVADLATEPASDGDGPIYDFSGPRRTRTRRPYKDEEIVAAIKAWNEAHGRPPTSTDWNPAARRKFAKNLVAKARQHLGLARMFEEGPWPSVQTVRVHFGSMNAALVAAGFEPRAPGRQPVREPEPITREANEIARTEGVSEDRFRRLVARLVEAKRAGDTLAQRALWYELAEVAVTLGDRLPDIEEAVRDAA